MAQPRVNLTLKECIDCHSWLPLAQFHVQPDKRDGRCSSCKDCKNIRSRAIYMDNYDDNIARSRAYYSSHKNQHADVMAKYRMTSRGKAVHDASENKRRAVKRGTETENLSWLYTEIRKSPVVICHICGSELSGSDCHLDHVIPLSRGGTHTVDNLLPSCPFCNQSKHNRLDWESNPARADLSV